MAYTCGGGYVFLTRSGERELFSALMLLVWVKELLKKMLVKKHSRVLIAVVDFVCLYICMQCAAS